MQTAVRMIVLFAALAPAVLQAAADASSRPNVILVMTDDQGYGDLGAHGNPVLKTPNLDQFARQSVELEQFYVCPVCSPTRSSLMTGRYNYRTGIVDTFLGRSLMFADEVDAGGNALGGRVPDRHLRQVAPGRQLPDAGHGPGLSGIAGHQRGRARPAF